MKKINHLVFRNGKMIPKSVADAQHNKPPTISFTKPIATVVLSGEQTQDNITIMKTAYEQKIKYLNQKIQILQKDLSVHKIRLAKYQAKQNEQKYKNIEDGIQTEESYEINQLCIPLSQQQGINNSQLSSIGFLTQRKSCDLNTEIKDNKNQREQQGKCKNKFNSSSLMERLAHSENLVKNIKKFLVQPKNKNQRSDSHRKQNYCSFQIQKFLMEIQQKNNLILSHLDTINRQKQEQIQQICQYYQSLIKQLVLSNNTKQSTYSYSQNQFPLKLLDSEIDDDHQIQSEN